MIGNNYIELGCTPSDEECAQVGEENYESNARAECQRYIELLRRLFGPEPEGAALRIKQFPHDFGFYLEVVCYHDGPVARDYAFNIENNAPTSWDAVAVSPSTPAGSIGAGEANG